MTSFNPSPGGMTEDDFLKSRPQYPPSHNANQSPPDGVLLAFGFTDLSVEDHCRMEVRDQSSAPTSSNSETKKARGVYTPPFNRANVGNVDNSGNSGNSGNNPFSSPATGKYRRSSPSSSNDNKKLAMNTHWRSARSDSSSGSGFNSPSKKTSFTQKLVAAIGNDPAADPQALFPPSCCVFVANLAQSETDSSLEFSVTAVFRQFGHCYVKVRRDDKSMPFSFVQYKAVEHAERAIKEGRGLSINDRPCRVEKAKAHRVYYFQHKFGSPIAPNEVFKMLQRFGTIISCYEASITQRAQLDANEGVIVAFEMYDAGQTAFNAFRGSDLYKMQAVANMNKEKARKSPRASDGERAYMRAYDIDRHSIWVGNLPAGVTEDQVFELFRHIGAIQKITTHDAPSKFQPYGMVAFAFIEFKNPVCVTLANEKMNGTMYAGRVLRTAQKDSTIHHRNGQNAVPSPPSHVPAAPTAPSAYNTPPPQPAGHPVASVMQTPSPSHGSTNEPAAPHGYYGYPTYEGFWSGVPQYCPPPTYGGAAYPSPYNYHYGGGPVYGAYATGDTTTGTPGSSPVQQQNNFAGYAYPAYSGYSAYPAYPTYPPFPAYQYPAAPIYATPAAALAAQAAEAPQTTHAHPQTVDNMTNFEEEDRSATPTPLGQFSASDDLAIEESD